MYSYSQIQSQPRFRLFNLQQQRQQQQLSYKSCPQNQHQQQLQMNLQQQQIQSQQQLQQHLQQQQQQQLQQQQQQTQAKKSKWSPEEDELLRHAVEVHGEHNWKAIETLVPGRNSKQCRERWTAQLNPGLNRDEWTAQEDTTLIQMQSLHGNLWAKISSFLPGRSANAVKNRFNWLTRRNLPQKMFEIYQQNNRCCSSLPSDEPPFFQLSTHVKAKSLDNADEDDSYLWESSADFIVTPDGRDIDASFSDQWFY